MKHSLVPAAKIFSLISVCLCFILFFATCGGGGGGAAGASIPASEYTTHNATGYGGGSNGGNSGGSINLQGGTPLTVISYSYGGNTYTAAQINDLITAIANDGSRPAGVFTVDFMAAGDTGPRQARVTKTSQGVEKFEHQYKATCTNNGTVSTFFFYADEGLNLASQTTSNMAGWRCSGNNQLYGSFIPGMQGDITLNAEFVSFTATKSKTNLTASTDTAVVDTATITITGGIGPFTVTPNDSTFLQATTPVEDSPGSTIYTSSISIKEQSGSFVWFDDDKSTSVTVTDTSNGETSILNFTLKNKYSYQILKPDNTVAIGPTDIDQDGTIDLDQIKTNMSSYVPDGREIVAFKDEAVGGKMFNLSGSDKTLKFNSENDTENTANTGNFKSRNVSLKAILDFTISAKDATYASWSGATPYTNISNQTGMKYTLEKYSNTTKQVYINLSDYSDYTNITPTPSSGASNYLNIGSVSSSGSFSVTLKNDPNYPITHDDIPSSGLTYTITITDSGTGAVKYIHILVARPAEYTYSLYYINAAGTQVAIGTTNQNVVFTPGTQIDFGCQNSILTMGDLDSSLSGISAAIQITGWTGTGPYSNPLSYGAFPNPGAADCTSNAITLIATTSPDIATLYSNCRANSNAVVAGDVVLSNGLCVPQSYYNNNTTTLAQYVVGIVCTRGASDDQKFVVAKNPNQKLNWDTGSHANIGGLQVTISGTNQSSDADEPLYELEDIVSFSNDSSGKNSLSILESAGQNVNDYPAFKYCRDYKPTGVTTGYYASGWYLPSIAEACAIHQKLNTFPSGFVVDQPWFMTSSQYNQNKYWYTQGGLTPGIASICAESKNSPGHFDYVYPCHELNFVAP